MEVVEILEAAAALVALAVSIKSTLLRKLFEIYKTNIKIISRFGVLKLLENHRQAVVNTKRKNSGGLIKKLVAAKKNADAINRRLLTTSNPTAISPGTPTGLRKNSLLKIIKF